MLLFAFLSFTVVPPGFAQTIPIMPRPGTMVPVSPGFMPAHLKGIKIFADNPLQFDFFVHRGDTDENQVTLEQESLKLIKYFLATLTIPENELWVNLSPYEEGRIIPERFGQTQMGRDLLAQDYLLKQLTASLMYPEDELGKKFWDRVYKRAYELYGTTEIPINTFNKVWIVPDKAVVFEDGDTAYVIESHLKVMLEEDYRSLSNNLSDKTRGTNELKEEDVRVLSNVSSQVVKEVLIPEIEREVNEGENFASLRQIYSSMILAAWFKKNLKESLLAQVYVDQKKTKGIDTDNPKSKEMIYEQYLEAFKQGVYNLVKEDYDPVTQETIARRYISGGFDGPVLFNVTQTVRRQDIVRPNGSMNFSSMSTAAQANILALPEAAVEGNMFRVGTRFFEFGRNASASEVRRIADGPNLSTMNTALSSTPEDFEGFQAYTRDVDTKNFAKMLGEKPIPHQEIKGRPESIFSVNRAIRLSYNSGKVADISEALKAGLKEYLENADINAVVAEVGVSPETLKAKLADAETKMVLVEDVQARSPVLVIRNQDNFQAAHIGPSKQNIYFAKGFVEQLQRSGANEDQEILKAFMVRELVALIKFNETYVGNNYDDAIRQAEDVAERFEKAILTQRLGDGSRLDSRLRQSVREFIEAGNPTFHLGVRNGLQLMAGRYKINLRSDAMDNLSVHKEFVQKAFALPVAQQTALLRNYQSFIDRNAMFMGIYFSPAEGRELEQLRPKMGYYQGDHLTSFPAQELAAFDYVRNFQPQAFRDEIERAKQDVPPITTQLSHEELFGYLRAASSRVLSGLTVHPDIRDQLTHEIEAQIYKELLKRPSTDPRIVFFSDTTSRDGHQSNIGTNLTGVEQRAIIKNSLRYGNLRRVETWGGAVPQVALLKGRRGGQLPEDPFYNLREQTKLLREHLEEVIGADMDKISADDQRLLFDRYETKVDRKILRPQELEQLLARTSLLEDKKQAVRKAYEVKQQMLLRGEFIVGLTPYPDAVLKKFIETAYKNGMDVFRVFDAFNDPRSIKRAIKHVKAVGGYVQPVVHYTDTFALGVDGYAELAKDLIEYSGENLDTLTVKDAPGVLDEKAAYEVFSGLRQRGITAPLQLHTHDSRGNRLLVLLEAIRGNGTGHPITVDVASGELAGPFAQVNIRQVMNTVRGTAWEGGLGQIDEERLQANEQLIREQLLVRQPIAPITSKERRDVTYARLPGGMKSNFDVQIMNEGLRNYWAEVAMQFGVFLFDFRLSAEGLEFMKQRYPELVSLYGLEKNFDATVLANLTVKDTASEQSIADRFKEYARANKLTNTNLFSTDRLLPSGQKFLDALMPLIYEEMRQVVNDMGGISMVTPASQWVGVQAFQNIISGWIPRGWIDYDLTNNKFVKRTEAMARQQAEGQVSVGLLDASEVEVSIESWTFPEGQRDKQYASAMKIVPGLQNYLIMRAQDPGVLGRMYPNVSRDVAGLAFTMIGESTIAAQLDEKGMAPARALAKYDVLKGVFEKELVDMAVVKVFKLAQTKPDTKAAVEAGRIDRAMALRIAGQDPKLNIPLTLDELQVRRDAQRARNPEINTTDEDLMLLALFPEQNQFMHLIEERAKAREQYERTSGQGISAETLRSMGINNIPEIANRSSFGDQSDVYNLMQVINRGHIIPVVGDVQVGRFGNFRLADSLQLALAFDRRGISPAVNDVIQLVDMEPNAPNDIYVITETDAQGNTYKRWVVRKGIDIDAEGFEKYLRGAPSLEQRESVDIKTSAGTVIGRTVSYTSASGDFSFQQYHLIIGDRTVPVNGLDASGLSPAQASAYAAGVLARVKGYLESQNVDFGPKGAVQITDVSRQAMVREVADILRAQGRDIKEIASLADTQISVIGWNDFREIRVPFALAHEETRLDAKEPLRSIDPREFIPFRSPLQDSGGNRSTLSRQSGDPLGGIDLNPQLLDLQIKRDPSGIPLPMPQQPIKNMNIEGFLPVIMNVTPVTNMPSFLLGGGPFPADTVSDISLAK